MFTTLDLIKDIINNKFIQTNKITQSYIKQNVNKNDLIPIKYDDGEKIIRKKFNIFNKDKLNVIEKQITTNDEINKLNYIITYLCENDIHNIIFEKTSLFKVNLIYFFNVKKYETSKEIKYDVYCIFLITLSGRLWQDIYKLSFVINKDLSNLNKVLRIDELYEIKEYKHTINNSSYYNNEIPGYYS